MPNRGLIVAAVLLVLLGGGIYWSNLEEEKKAGAPAKDAPPKILEIPEDQFTKVDIKRRDGTGATLERQASGWRLTAPKALPVDARAVQNLVSALALVSAERVVDEKPANLMQYGFSSPAVEVTISRKDGKSHRLLIGEDSPLGSAVYAKVEADPRLFTVATATKAAVDKVWQDLRDRRLLTFYEAKLSRIDLNGIEFVKKPEGWSIAKPKEWRADNFAVEELVRKLVEAKMEIVPEDEEQGFGALFAKAAPFAIAKATDDQGTQQLEVRKDAEGQFFAKSTAVEGFFKLPTEAVDGLRKTAEEFRSKKLFEFGFTEPAKVEGKHEGKSWAFEKKGNDWWSAGKKIDPGSVQQLVDLLRELKATKFAAALAGQPLAEWRVTLPGKPVEQVTILKQGETFFAQRPGDATIYELDAAVVEALRKLAAEAKQLP